MKKLHTKCKELFVTGQAHMRRGPACRRRRVGCAPFIIRLQEDFLLYFYHIGNL